MNLEFGVRKPYLDIPDPFVLRVFEGLIVTLALEPLVLSVLARLNVFIVGVVGAPLGPVAYQTRCG